MQPKQDIPMPRKDDNALKNFGVYEDKKSTLKKQDIKRDCKDLVGKSSNTESYAKDNLLGCTP